VSTGRNFDEGCWGKGRGAGHSQEGSRRKGVIYELGEIETAASGVGFFNVEGGARVEGLGFAMDGNHLHPRNKWRDFIIEAGEPQLGGKLQRARNGGISQENGSSEDAGSETPK